MTGSGMHLEAGDGAPFQAARRECAGRSAGPRRSAYELRRRTLTAEARQAVVRSGRTRVLLGNDGDRTGGPIEYERD